MLRFKNIKDNYVTVLLFPEPIKQQAMYESSILHQYLGQMQQLAGT